MRRWMIGAPERPHVVFIIVAPVSRCYRITVFISPVEPVKRVELPQHDTLAIDAGAIDTPPRCTGFENIRAGLETAVIFGQSDQPRRPKIPRECSVRHAANLATSHHGGIRDPLFAPAE